MSAITPISRLGSIRRIEPVRHANAGRSYANAAPHADSAGAARAPAAGATHANRAPVFGPYAPFITQQIANDNPAGPATSANQGAIAYLIERDRISDLPMGFLIVRAA